MSGWLDANADGIALALLLSLIGLLAIAGAWCIERLVDPGASKRFDDDGGTAFRRRITDRGGGQRWGRRDPR